MAIFSSAEDAVQAAVEMQNAVEKFNKRNPENIRIGVGLHTGELMLGIIGEKERLEVTVISDAVNLASRMEGLTKRYGVDILISRQTFELLGNRDLRLNNVSLVFLLLREINCLAGIFFIKSNHFRCLGQVKVKGRHEAVHVYEVYSGQEKPNLESGLELYRNRLFTEAQQHFEGILQSSPGDKATKYYEERCEYCQSNGPPEDWSGVEDLN